MPQDQQSPVAAIAYDELSSPGSSLGPSGYQELLAVASRVSHAHRNEAMVTELDLGHEAAETLLHTLGSTDGLARVVQAATDADSFTRILSVALRNTLIDASRASPAGALARRVVDTLRREDRFEQLPSGQDEGEWCVIAAACQPERDESSAPAGDRVLLVEAAWNTDLAPYPDWSGNRRTPVCTDAELVSMIEAIIEAADGTAAISDIIYAVKHRFGFHGGFVSLDEAVHFVSNSESAETHALDVIEVQEVIGGLSHDETVILQSLIDGLTVRALAVQLGCSPSTAATKRRVLESMLESLVWTSEAGSSSDTGIRGKRTNEETQ